MTEYQQRLQAEADTMLAMHEKGMTNREIAAATGRNVWQVADRLAKRGVRAGGMRRRKLMAERGDEIAAMAKAGKTDKEIAAAVGFSPSQIPRILHELGCETASEARMKCNAELRARRKADAVSAREQKRAVLDERAMRMREMVERGMSTAEIAGEFGVSERTVQRWVKETGLVRDNDWKHRKLVETAKAQALAANVEIVGEPRNHHADLRCPACGHEWTLSYTMGSGIGGCPACRRRASEMRAAEMAERSARAAERIEANKRRKAARQLVNLLTPRVCTRCGRVFHSRRAGELLFCSDECRRKEWHSNHYDRARKYGGEYERGITLGKLVERDGLECYLCGRTCDWEDKRWGSYGPDHPTIDHVVPLSKGGGHTWENVKVACGRCNADKRDIILKGDRGKHG